MASEAPDPNSFQSWQEAFQYPIPAVRGMEKQLLRDVESHREKLRTLVGASYRDLLGTAESIIEMDRKMHKVETLMEDIGRKCNSRIMDRKGTNLKAWSQETGARDASQFAFTSQLAVLRRCSDVIADILRNGTSLLVAAKVLVISRLLHTKLNKRPNPPPYLETLRARLATLRRRLLNRIERQVKSLETKSEQLVEAMCAFSLATSSGPVNVLRHMHHLRLEAISEHVDSNRKEAKQHAMLTALRLYVKTLQDTKATMPAQLSASLQSIKATPLYRGQDVQQLTELNLDIHERWIGDDIKGFTPFIRHDELGRADSEKMLASWAKTAIKTFLTGLQRYVEDLNVPEQLMLLRREVLEVWLSQQQYRLGVNASEVLDGLRDVFNDRAVTLIQRQASALEDVGSIIEISVLADWKPGVSDQVNSLWSSEMTSMDTAAGAKGFRQRLIDLSAGKNDDLLGVCEAYVTWLDAIRGIETLIQEAKKLRWTDDVDDIDDDDSLLEDRQVLLSQDDPRTLEEALRDGLFDAFKHLEAAVQKTYDVLEEGASVHKAVFILRTLRELRSHLPSSVPTVRLGWQLVSSIHGRLAVSVVERPLQRCSTRLSKFLHAVDFPTRALWEGDPELPVLPSLWAYRLLLDLTQSMAEIGSDVWNPDAVKKLKREASVRTHYVLTNPPEKPSAVNGTVNGEHEVAGSEADAGEAKERETEAEDGEAEVVDGETQAEDAGEQSNPPEDSASQHDEVNGVGVGGQNHLEDATAMKKEKSLQRLYDILYLGNALGAQEDQEASLQAVETTLITEVDPEQKFVERMRKGAGEYWKRTSLLFGLLA